MRIFFQGLFTLICFASCGPDRNDPDSIVFETKAVQSESLLATPVLRFKPGAQHLDMRLDLKNLAPETLKLMLVIIQNDNGMPTFAEGLKDKTIKIEGGQDTTLALTFHPINDKALFKTTGLHGLIDSTYRMQVYYTVEGKEGTRVVNLESRMPKQAFLAYRKSHALSVQMYSFKTTDNFDEKQREYLTSTMAAGNPPFVHTTEQELAVLGMNFRMKCFHVNDSLHTELFVVNHSDMTIRIDPTKLDVVVSDGMKDSVSHTDLSIQKVVGSKEEPEILRNGDRALIKMRKSMKTSPGKLKIALKDSFRMSDGKSLFNTDIQLEESSGSY